MALAPFVVARVLLLHAARLHCEHWICPLEYGGLPALGQDHRRGRHGVDYHPPSHLGDTADHLRSSSGSQRDHPCPADTPTISPSNMSAPASVEPVRISLLLERTTQDFVSLRPVSRPSRATLVLTSRKMPIARFPAFVDMEGWAHAAESNVVSSQQKESPENVLVSPPPEELPQNVLARSPRRRSREACLFLLRQSRRWSPCWSPFCRRSSWKPWLLRRCPEICGGPWSICCLR